MSMLNYAFLLPIRPPLQQYESFTSYCIRLAEANLITTPNAFAKLLLFPSITSTLSEKRPLTDVPLASFGLLPQAVNLSEQELSLTTFSHLLNLLDRRPRQARRFFGDTISETLRYCPLCLLERRRYLLHWNFHYLEGCPRHCCTLLNSCPHCNLPIQPWKPPLKLSICTDCGGSLVKANALKLHLELHKKVIQQWRDLNSLLYPLHKGLEGTESANALRKTLVKMREEEMLTVTEAADRAKVNRTNIAGLEQGLSNTKYGFTFSDVITYIQSFNKTIEEVVSMMSGVISSEESSMKRNNSGQDHKASQLITKNEDELLILCKNTVEKLQIAGLSVNPDTICSLLRIAETTLKTYPRVRQFLAESRQGRWDHTLKGLSSEEVDEVRKKRIIAAINFIKEQGAGLRKETVYYVAGVAKKTCQGKPELERLIDANVIAHYRMQAEVRQNEVTSQSKDIRGEAIDRPKPRNKAAIERMESLTLLSRDFEERYRTSTDPDETVRLHMLWLTSIGMPRHHIAYITDTSVSTVRTVVINYGLDRDGEKLQGDKIENRGSPVLSAEQQQELRELLNEAIERGEPWNEAAVLEWISRKINKSVSLKVARRYYIKLSPVPVLVKPRKRSAP